MRFINHSSEPNIKFVGNVAVSLRDINPGEELLCDYYTITLTEHADKLLGK